MTKTEDELRREIVEIGRWIHGLGFVAGYDGNISARLDTHRILSTPTTISKGMMQPDDLVVVDYEGQKVTGRRNVTSVSCTPTRTVKQTSRSISMTE